MTRELYMPNVTPKAPMIAWWSGGITSAVACKLCIDWFGIDSVIVVSIDTRNEEDDTARFQKECEEWYHTGIISIRNKNYNSIQEVWLKFLSLNVAKGAICSTELKRQVREEYQKSHENSHQAFGFDISEIDRAIALRTNHPDSKPFYPLINQLLSKKDCIRIVQQAGLRPPVTYEYGFNNNNCFKTGCVQGGIGYWQKMKIDFPDKFDAMAKMEHKLTDLKGIPVTMLKDQSKKSKGLVFLKPHPGYPKVKDISMMKGREPQPLLECNGFCGTNDLRKKNKTEKEINYAE